MRILFAATFAFENMATLALAVNLVTYFNGVMHMIIADAATELTTFMGVSYILSIFVAFLADTYIGRFKTVIISASLEFLVLKFCTISFPQKIKVSCIQYRQYAVIVS